MRLGSPSIRTKVEPPGWGAPGGVRTNVQDEMVHEAHHNAFNHRDGNGSVLGRISVGFRSSGIGFRDDFSPIVFRFWAAKLIGFGFGFQFSPLDTQWITIWSKNSYFIVYLGISLFT